MGRSLRLNTYMQALDEELAFNANPYVSSYYPNTSNPFPEVPSPIFNSSPESTSSFDSFADVVSATTDFNSSVPSTELMLGLMTPSGTSLALPQFGHIDNDNFGIPVHLTSHRLSFVPRHFFPVGPSDGHNQATYSSCSGNTYSGHHRNAADNYYHTPSSASYTSSVSYTSSTSYTSSVSYGYPPLPEFSLVRVPVWGSSPSPSQQAWDSEQDMDGEHDGSESEDEYVPSRPSCAKPSRCSRAEPSRCSPKPSRLSRAKPSCPAQARRQTARTRRYAPYALAESSTVPSSSSQFRRTASRNEQFDEAVRPPPAGTTECEYCGASYKRWSDLNRHVRSHSKKALRILCGGLPKAEAIRAGVTVEAKMPFVHEGVEYYGGCMTEFTRKDSLSRHLLRSRRCVGSITIYNLERTRRVGDEE
ncbi:hypothetical protein BKA93DRAFT_829541 [Sparassis latifolia]|uniref:C2H2-type domain-containing protein n=1 Tax=Sparassis crispa TaxID=139825 RepID=A0A401H066_9APHY|nr:hypothetical protein SCP_1200400 [Sparassis crispa]GBE87815.1 hypothetical protein SCP_1200400 [Sparassis crispa]